MENITSNNFTGENIDAPSFFQLPNIFYNITYTNNYKMSDHVKPLSDMMRLIFYHKEGYPEKSFILYVTEQYEIKVLDTSLVRVGKDPEEIVSTNLMLRIQLKFGIK